MPQKQRSRNDQRSDVHNPAGAEFKAAMDNHANQSNTNNDAYRMASNNRSSQMNPNNPVYQNFRRKN